MIAPTVHLNGTSADDLIAGYRYAMEAVDAAIDAVKATGPNGRDYYVQGPAALEQAQDEHRSRLVRLTAIADELRDLAIAVMDQKGG
jgi:hypothetical protein